MLFTCYVYGTYVFSYWCILWYIFYKILYIVVSASRLIVSTLLCPPPLCTQRWGHVGSLCTQRWGHVCLPLSAQCVCCVLSCVCPVCPAVSIVQAEAAHTRRWPNAGLMLVNRLRRWGLYSLRTVSTTRPACYWTQPSKHEALNQCWFDAGPAWQTVGQHWNSIGSTSSVCWECWQTTLCFAHPHGSKME